MTTPNHIIQSIVITSVFTTNPYISAIAGFLGGLPDIVHLLDDKGSWKWYTLAHKHTWFNWLIPFYNLHLLEDMFVHNPNGGTNKFYIPLEIIFWLIIILYIII